jgi:serine phosphatase RsbU (regulator of sigma subunit)
LEIKIALAKTNKYSVSDSGDSAEFTERPRGGLSVILADAQGSGKSARTNSKLIVSKCVSLISDGARDGAVARAVHDMLYALRDGRVSSTLTIVSADLETKSVVICQNGGPPIFVVNEGTAMFLPASAPSIGVHRNMKPNVCEFPMAQGLAVLGMSDGIYAAGRNRNNQWQNDELMDMLVSMRDNPEVLVTHLLDESVRRDGGRAADDMSAFVLYLDDYDHEPKIRKMTVRLPC